MSSEKFSSNVAALSNLTTSMPPTMPSLSREISSNLSPHGEWKRYHQHLLALYQQRVLEINARDKLEIERPLTDVFRNSSLTQSKSNVLRLRPKASHDLLQIDDMHNRTEMHTREELETDYHAGFKRRLSEEAFSNIQPLDLTETPNIHESVIRQRIPERTMSPPSKKRKTLLGLEIEDRTKDNLSITEIVSHDYNTKDFSLQGSRKIVRPKVIKPKPASTSFMISNLVPTATSSKSSSSPIIKDQVLATIEHIPES